ncbi:MAG TPA: hypothetical protein VNA20_03085 [Frankiaceae bacterium]|nr:hypothetical protein [Frankiaceae bacterium]
MFRTAFVASAAAAALVLNAPVALASDAVYGCNWAGAQDDSVTGDTYVGVLSGYVVSPSGGAASLTCRLTVNGTTVATVSSAGAPVFGQSAWATVDPTDVVRVCADVTQHGATTTSCAPWLPVQQMTVWLIVDPTVCAGLIALEGTYPLAEIDEQGDVYVAGSLFYDCPPYNT